MRKNNSEDIYSVLFETGKLVNSTLDTDAIIKNIVKIVGVKLGYEEFSFLIMEGDYLILKGAHNNPRWGDSKYKIPVGKGITGTVAKTGHPILANDIRKDERYIVLSPEFLSELAVPIKIDGKVYGVFNLESKELNAFSQQDLKLISALADQTALAIKNASLYHTYAETIKRLTNLNQAGKAINSSLELDRILKTLVEISSKELKYDSIAILLLKNGRLHTRAGLGFTEEELDTYSANIGEGVCGKVAETGEPLMVNDVSKCPFYISQSSRTKSEMALPIKYGDKVIGVYNVESNYQDSFDNDDLLFVSALAEHAAIALKNAELFQEIETFNESLKEKIAAATKELMLANENLVKLDKVKTDFVSIVSHELRTPMTSIIGYIDLVKDEQCGQINQQQKEFLGIAQEESLRLYRLIRDLLDIQKIESGKMIYLFRELDLNKFFESYIKEVERECYRKKLKAGFAIPHLPKITADEDKFKQILTNLVSNSIKFTKEGEIRIEASVLPEYIRVSVSDTGIGIAEKDMNRLFQKFSQIYMDANRQVGGTGLGLAITKNLVESHGGRIRVESKPGIGSTFTFTISRKIKPKV